MKVFESICLTLACAFAANECFNTKKKTMLNSLVCSGTHANGVMALTLPNNLDITSYGFLSPFQEKEKNN